MSNVDMDDWVSAGAPIRALKSVEALQPFVLHLEWEDGEVEALDVRWPIEAFFNYRALRDDPARFAGVRIVEFGYAIAWGDDELLVMPTTAIENYRRGAARLSA